MLKGHSFRGISQAIKTMTLTTQSQSNSWLKTNPHNIRNPKTAHALKRYLDLTLRGTKKNLEHPHSQSCTGRKGHPLSPYTFDRPEFEQTVHHVLQTKHAKSNGLSKTPNWVQAINERVKNHNGEAPMFTEQFLPTYKQEQHQPESRPLSGISTKSAPVVINGEMYYRPNRKHSYLQASHRPCSAKEGRETRASKLKNRHRAQSMSTLPSSDTKDQLKRMKDKKPKPLHLNKDLLPIPCHAGETAHSFIIGARYNCSHFMDSRSFARLGLYVPRENPHRTFLKTYKGEDGIEEPNSESDFVGFTSVRVGSNQQQKVSWKPPSGQRIQPSLPSPRVRKVIREAWLNGDLSNTGEQQRASRNSSHYSSVHRNESGEEGQMKRNYRAPSTTPRKQVPRAQSGSMNIKGQQVNNASPEPIASKRSTPGGSRVSKPGASPAERKRSIEAIIPCTD